MSTPRDYYEVLGIKRDATADEIRKAYRKLARQYHPDVNKAEDAAKRFTEISDAYEVLSSEEKRKQYDRFGHAGIGAGASARGGGGAGWPGGGGGHGGGQWQSVNVGHEDFSSIFEEIFGGRSGGVAGGGGAGGVGGVGGPFGGGVRPGQRARPQSTRGEDVQQPLSISFITAVRGGTEQLRISVNGQPAEAIDVRIPPGTRDGAKLRLKGKGRPGARGGANGDLILAITVGAHPYFRRDGLDLLLDVPISIAEAARGTTVNIPLLNGTADLRVPPGASSGRKLRIKGKGITGADGKAGDFYAEIQIVAPATLTDRGSELINELADELPDPRVDVAWKSGSNRA